MTREEFKKLPSYVLDRVYLSDRVLGSIVAPGGGLVCKTLELPWKENQRQISCIPESGTLGADEFGYLVTLSTPVPVDDPDTLQDESGGRHPRNYWHYIVHNVPGRSGILIHRGKTPAWSKGCITVGGKFGNVNSETPTLEDSAEKLQDMVQSLPKTFRLIVEAKSGKAYV